MTTVAVEKTDLKTCVRRAQGERIVVTHDGVPVALIVGIEGLDEEQVRLGASDKFWRMIRERRKDKILSRAELEKAIRGKPETTKSRRRPPRK